MKERLCTVDGCEGKHVARGFCRTHYYRFKRYGNPLEVRQIQSKHTDGSCKIKDCTRKHYAKGYCKYHHYRWEKYGDPLYERPTTCSIDGCDNPLEAKGLCQKHYRRLRVNGSPFKVKKMVNAPCKVEGCKNKNRRNGYCEEHYRQSALYRNRHRFYSAKRRSLQVGAPINDFTKQDWKESLKHFNYRCAYCDSTEHLEQEHIRPLTRGGSHTKSNIIPACRSCNSSKRQSTLEEWYHNQPFYSKEREMKILSWMGCRVNDNKIQLQLF